MFIAKKSINRRAMLRGMGAAVALPLLDAMIPAFGAEPERIRRFGAVYVPNGMNMDKWTPAATENNALQMSPILQPLSDFKEKLLVLGGMSHTTAKAALGEGPGDHARGCATFLSGVHPKKTQGSDFRSGVSADQMVAAEFGKKTPIASLEICLDSTEVIGSCDFDYSCTYVNTLSWKTPTTPLPVENSPRVIFERLFGDGNTADPQVRLKRLQENASLLDSVTQDVAFLGKSLGPRDRTKLSEYLDAVRDVERSIQQTEAKGAIAVSSIERPADIPNSYEEHAKLMFDLVAIAYQADLTRVCTFMMGHEVSSRSYPEIGVPDSHHPLSHHQNDPGRLERLQKINTLHTNLFAYHLGKLRSISDGNSTLLDNVMILYGAGLSDSNLHAHDDLPTLLAGGGGGWIKGGRHIQYPVGTPLSNVLLSMLNRLGLHLDHLGDSTGELQEIGRA